MENVLLNSIKKSVTDAYIANKLIGKNSCSEVRFLKNYRIEKRIRNYYSDATDYYLISDEFPERRLHLSNSYYKEFSFYYIVFKSVCIVIIFIGHIRFPE